MDTHNGFILVINKVFNFNLQCRARSGETKMLQHLRVQDAKYTNLLVVQIHITTLAREVRVVYVQLLVVMQVL